MTTGAPTAISRLDDGIALPGDRELADLFDRHCSDRWHAVEVRLDSFDADRCVIRDFWRTVRP